MASIPLNETFNGQKVTVQPGDIIELQLEENPTTGYIWETSGVDNSEFELMAADYALYSTAGIGGGGKRTFRFKVIKPGGRLKLENKQSWSGDVYKIFEVSFA